MDTTQSEVLQFVAENDVKFIRLAFCDIFGVQKNISIMPGELPRAFASGISFDASAVKGFMNVEESDLFLFPDPATLAVLPWRPQTGRVVRLFCDIRHPDGSPFAGDGRHILRQAVSKADAMGYACHIGTECEFYLFQADEEGCPTDRPHDRVGYLDVAPLDRGENVRRQICLTLEEMGITSVGSHHEAGPGQNEIDLDHTDPLSAADNLITFKSVVSAAASQNGLWASFMPKPLAAEGGSGLHVNISLFKRGQNIFRTDGAGHSPEAESFIAGVLAYAPDITVFLNPVPQSYQRLGSFEAPKFITWSHQNRSQLIRIPAATGEFARMEMRSPDPACNPYLAFALLLQAGLTGIMEKRSLEPPTNLNLYQLDSLEEHRLPRLPASLSEALECAAQSAFLDEVLDPGVRQKYCLAKSLECL